MYWGTNLFAYMTWGENHTAPQHLEKIRPGSTQRPKPFEVHQPQFCPHFSPSSRVPHATPLSPPYWTVTIYRGKPRRWSPREGGRVWCEAGVL